MVNSHWTITSLPFKQFVPYPLFPSLAVSLFKVAYQARTLLIRHEGNRGISISRESTTTLWFRCAIGSPMFRERELKCWALMHAKHTPPSFYWRIDSACQFWASIFNCWNWHETMWWKSRDKRWGEPISGANFYLELGIWGYWALTHRRGFGPSFSGRRIK
jgi:hypothetical protein